MPCKVKQSVGYWGTPVDVWPWGDDHVDSAARYRFNNWLAASKAPDPWISLRCTILSVSLSLSLSLCLRVRVCTCLSHSTAALTAPSYALLPPSNHSNRSQSLQPDGRSGTAISLIPGGGGGGGSKVNVCLELQLLLDRQEISLTVYRELISFLCPIWAEFSASVGMPSSASRD